MFSICEQFGSRKTNVVLLASFKTTQTPSCDKHL